MIRDYKFDSDFSSRKKRHPIRRFLGVLLILGAIAGIVALQDAGVSILPWLNSGGEISFDQLERPISPLASESDTAETSEEISGEPQIESIVVEPLAIPNQRSGADLIPDVQPSSELGTSSEPDTMNAAVPTEPPSPPSLLEAPSATQSPAQVLLAEQATDMEPNGNQAADATDSDDDAATPVPVAGAPEEPDPAIAETADDASPTAEMGPVAWREHVVSAGDSLARIFKEFDLSPALLHKIVNSSEAAKSLADIRPGEILRVRFNDDDELAQLVLQRNRVRSLEITATDAGFDSVEITKDLDKQLATAGGTIQSSLFVDGQAAGLSDAQIMELAAIFGWDIDFALEIRAGDQFRLVYEEQYLDGEKFRNGPILAAEFSNRGTIYRAVRFEDKEGNSGYYDEDGHNKKRAFIRTPLKFARVSSGFSTNRWHPVLQKWRSHKGVDYAAPTGTPVKATGAGKVTFRGWKGGYGRVVMIQHAQKYMTVYAHLSKFVSKVDAGSKVKQGQMIGYVGQSGLASGPHLHYEFRVDGVHRNPLTVKLPKSLPLPDSERPAFKKATAPLLAKLDAVPTITMVAATTDATQRSK